MNRVVKRIVILHRIVRPMPTKTASLIFFLIAASMTFGLQYFVYRQLRRLIHKDFPEKAARFIKTAKWVFILMNIPVVFLFIKGRINVDMGLLSQIMLYPYTIWQFLMMMWAVILTPVTLTRIIRIKLLPKLNGSAAR
jgi:hypothetical protein